ncbi:hypothetical protein FAZ95_04210 [Trinickia violacea]|uniref:Uncharacterized protein n=1 Tax=Trinickia violacea TaxID=2571746 RepID=A0A4V1EGZ2_9BURK|nr:hypothetical protein [Trinickia violacea]QCP48460.1 hypothetical protein FAZ95_04210 [Trinickia violacea]
MDNEKAEEMAAADDYRHQQQVRYGSSAEQALQKLQTLRHAAIAHTLNALPTADLDMVERALDDPGDVKTALDEPLSHSLVKAAVDKIETAAENIGFNLRNGVSFGALFAEGSEAMQAPVFGTETSLVMLTSNLLLLVHRLSKLLALSVPLKNKREGFTIEKDFRRIEKKLLKNENLMSQWYSLYYDYSHNPTTPARGDFISIPGEREFSVQDDISESMMWFVVGHEYGHHIMKHGSGGIASAEGEDRDRQHGMELEADMLATWLCMEAGNSEPRNNVFALANAGAVALLATLEFIRKGNQILKNGKSLPGSTRDSHPGIYQRRRAISFLTERLSSPRTSYQFISLQNLYYRIVATTWNVAAKRLAEQHVFGVRPIERTVEWLPR